MIVCNSQILRDRPASYRGSAVGMVLCASSVFVLLACNNDAPTATRASQVVARVNGSEITVHQLEHELSSRSQDSEGKVDTDEVVEELINRQLFTQKAHEAKLDRSPEAVLALDRARAQILSEMYLKAVVTHSAQPNEVEVRDYYNQHPELFAQRRIYQFRQLDLSEGVTVEQAEAWRRATENIAALEMQLVKDKKLERVLDRTLAAEELPLDFVITANQLKPASTAVMKIGKRVSIMLLQNVKADPVTVVQAAPHIVRFLANQRERQVINDEIFRLRQVSRVDRLRTPADAEPQAKAAATVQQQVKVGEPRAENTAEP
jgi:EpsD family peptidyl-prolyl cis-trans isomerase